MEIEKIPSIILLFVLVGMIIGVGVLIFDEFGQQVQEDYAVENETMTITDIGNGGGVGQMQQDEIVSVQWFGNNSGGGPYVNSTNSSSDGGIDICQGPSETTNCEVMWYRNGSINITANFIQNASGIPGYNSSGSDFGINYTYERDTKATQTLTYMKNATTPIANTWIALIVTVLFLAVVLGLVIRAFAGQGR